MCPSENPSARMPQLPKRLESLFDNEAGSDVTFLVGPETETWRFPGHRSILSDANPVFRAMLQGPLAHREPTVEIHDIDGKAFDLLLRFLYGQEVMLGSVPTALNTLYAAHKYMCAGLVHSCVVYLNAHLNTQNVLLVYQHVRVYCSQLCPRALGVWIATAPPLYEECLPSYSVGVDKDPNDNLHVMNCLCSNLLQNCQHYIDTHADQVLADESIEDLCAEALREIVQRNSLGVSSEMVVFTALERWVSRECKRCQMPLAAENKRSLLGEELLFATRYLLLTSQQFLKGPGQSGLLDQTECAVLIAHIHNSPTKPQVPSLPPEIIQGLRTPRRNPHSTSLRSSPAKKGKKDKRDKKQKNKKKTKCIDKDKCDSPSKKCSRSCFLEYLCRALSCLFD